ncbi:polymorphic toxin type 25 domain-containing protein, partial [Escherichia coli]|nr:polymorphic toxin type 25 domain-containing protein [Escherichia coli]
TGKDGVSFTFGFGPSWGWSATEIKGVDVNGTSTSEVYRYDFK